MKLTFNFLIFFFLLSNSGYANLIKPNKLLKPIEIIKIQLNSLQKNNIPYKDAGIEQTWEFAHPNNKIITGPLEKFKKMIYSENYQLLIEHEYHEIIILEKTNNRVVYKVEILTRNKKKYFYIWQVEKVIGNGYLKDCWMTTNVSSPQYLGDTI